MIYIKRVKVFESGNYSQGSFDTKRVKKIFGDVSSDVKGIFIHSSKWKKENKEPLEIATFNNFGIKEENGVASVYADINFNDKGKAYYADGSIKGISVEIDSNDNLDKIAVLPIGTTPAVNGAEFEVGTAIFNLEFEESGEEMTREEFLKSLTIEDVKNLSFEGYTVDVKAIEKVKPKTEEEIVKEVTEKLKKEFEERLQVEKEVKEFEKQNSRKLTPKLKEILTTDVLKELFSKSNVLEFENKNLNLKDVIVNIFDTIPDLINTNSSNIEFENNGEDKSIQEIMKEAKERTEKMFKK